MTPPAPNQPLDRLRAIGFRLAGRWSVDASLIRSTLDAQFRDVRNFLYAFVVDGEVVYIGKSTSTLRQRMQQYRTPGASQRTNVRNNADLLGCLGAGRVADIYVLPDHGLLHYGGFHVNLAAGLEDGLIRDLRPAWNGGRRSDGKVAEPTPELKS